MITTLLQRNSIILVAQCLQAALDADNDQDYQDALDAAAHHTADTR